MFINSEDVYNRYVEDVICRNDSVLAFKDNCRRVVGEMPIEKVKKWVENFYQMEKAERGEAEKKTEENDFSSFAKSVRTKVIMNNFSTRPETLAVMDCITAAQKANDDTTLNQVIDTLYFRFETEITEGKLEEKIWKNKLIYKATDVANRKIIGEDFQADFDPQKDKGNCTKGITVSLYRAAQEYGLPILQTSQEKENAAHPKSLMEQFDKYVKTSESGFLKDIEDIKVGDIVVLSLSEQVAHAMMVSSFDEHGEALLLGFSATQKNVPMSASKGSGIPRKGWVIDVHSFVQDKVNEYNRQEATKILFGQRKGMSQMK